MFKSKNLKNFIKIDILKDHIILRLKVKKKQFFSLYHKIIYFIIFLTHGNLCLFEKNALFCPVSKKLFAFKAILHRCNHLAARILAYTSLFEISI